MKCEHKKGNPLYIVIDYKYIYILWVFSCLQI